MVASNQMSLLLGQDRRWTGVEGSQVDAALRAVRSHRYRCAQTPLQLGPEFPLLPKHYNLSQQIGLGRLLRASFPNSCLWNFLAIPQL